MTVIRALLDASPAEFPFLARTTEHQVLVPNMDRSPSQITPSWIQNYWALPGNRAGAIASSTGMTPVLPSEIVAKLATEAVRSYTVHSNGERTLMLVGETFWTALSESGWEQYTLPASSLDVNAMTLKGVTYLHNANDIVRIFDTTTNNFGGLVEFPLAGIEPTVLTSMCAAISYLVATDGETIYWSSPLNPKYWTPGGIGDDAGAGSSKILAVAGHILFLRPAIDGFYAFTTENIIYARYTNNSTVPWVFSEVANSSRVASSKHVAQDNNSGATFAWSAAGLVSISQNVAEVILPEVTELVSGSTWDEYDPIERNTRSSYGNRIDISLAFLQSRFLCLSLTRSVVGEQVLMFDTAIKKWSRLVIPCCCLLDYAQKTNPGYIFDIWTTTFGNTTMTFADMGAEPTASTNEAMTIAYLASNGKVTVLSPTDIYNDPAAWLGTTGWDITVLENVLLVSGLTMTRGQEVTLSEVTVTMVHPNYRGTDEDLTPNFAYRQLDIELPLTKLLGYSEADPTIRTYLVALAAGVERVYTERVIGRRISFVLENFSTLQGVEVALVPTGTRR